MVKKIWLILMFVFFMFSLSGVLGEGVDLTNPPNNTYSNNETQSFNSTLTGDNGISNATLYIYNSTGLVYNQTTRDFSVGKALSFDGVNDYVSMSNNLGCDNINFTISLWAKASILDANQVFN